ncbi:hypothetical protein L0F63_002918, partial [Massospora cicadina]
KAKLITPPLMAVSPTSITTLPMVENTHEADSERGYDNVGYYLLGAPSEVEVPYCLNAGGVDEATISEDTYLRQVLGEPINIDTASDADEVLSRIIRPIQCSHTMQSIQENYPETACQLTSHFQLREVLVLLPTSEGILTKVEMVIQKVQVMAILDTGSPVNVISSKLMKKIQLAPDLEYNQDFGTAGPNNTHALGAYSLLPIHIGKLILTAPTVALDNNDYEMLISTQFMIEYEGIINMKQGSLSLMNYKVPLVLTKEEHIKNDDTCLVEHPSPTVPLHYITSGRNTKKLHNSVKASNDIPISAADEVVNKPEKVQAPKVQPRKEKYTTKPAESANSHPKAQENQSSKNATPHELWSKPPRTEEEKLYSGKSCQTKTVTNKGQAAKKLQAPLPSYQ